MPLRKSGQWDALQMVAHKKPNLFADRCTANLRFGITVAVNQDTKKKNHCNYTGQSQNTVHVKLVRPQKLHNRVKQHKQAAGAGIQCLSPAKKYKLYKSSINKSIHFVQRSLSSSTRVQVQRVTAQINLSRE